MVHLGEDFRGFHFMQEMIRRCEGKTKVEEFKSCRDSRGVRGVDQIERREGFGA